MKLASDIETAGRVAVPRRLDEEHVANGPVVDLGDGGADIVEIAVVQAGPFLAVSD
jgi:hypothetical protein